MKKRNLLKALALSAAMAFSMLSGCGLAEPAADPAVKTSQLEETSLTAPAEPVSETGTLLLKVNPEIEISYDEAGLVTAVTGVNRDGREIVPDDAPYIGKSCDEVVRTLVEKIHDAGYFVEDAEGYTRQITIEIEKGSVLPQTDFLDRIAENVRRYIADASLTSPIDLIDGSATDYDITDYGLPASGSSQPAASQPGSSQQSTSQPGGYTDYTDYGLTDYGKPDYGTNYTDYGTNYTDYGTTDYTDYGTSYTDYGTTDYTDYGTNYTDYGTGNGR